MNQLDFYTEVTVDGIEEVDYLNNVLSKFTIRYTPGYYQIEQEDVANPDLISYKLYGTEQYWWVITLVNNIQNPLADMLVGMIITIPNILDIYEFSKKYRIIK